MPTGLGAIPPFAPMFRKMFGAPGPEIGNGTGSNVTLDFVGPGSTGAVGALSTSTSITWDHTVGYGPNRVLYVGVAIGAATDSMTTAVTYGGVAMTSIAKVHANNSTGGYVQLFRTLGPPVSAAPIKVTITGTTPITIIAGSVSYFNVDQTTPETITTAFGSSVTASVTDPGALGDRQLLLVGGGSPLLSTSDTVLWQNNRDPNSACGNAAMSHRDATPTGSQTWSITNDWWGAIGADIHQSFAADTSYSADSTLFSGTFETGDLTQWSGNTSSFLPSTPVVATSSPAPAEGTYRGALSIPAGTSVAGAGVDPRCEIYAPIRDFVEGDDYWFAGSTRLDPSFPIPASGQFSVLTQWKNEGAGSPPINLKVNNDTTPAHYSIDGGFGYPGGSQLWTALDDTANPATRDVWVNWVFHIHFSSDPSKATLDVWKDGVQVVTNFHSPTLAGTLYPGITSYWKIGYYRSEAITGAGTVYHDGWKAGKTAASVGFGSSTPITLTDTAAVADAVTVAAAAPVADTGHGTDAVTVAATAALAETGAGVDALSVTSPVPLADTAAGVDALAAAATVAAADTAAGADQITATATVALPADSGSGADALASTAAVPLADTGTGLDALTVSQSSNPTLPDTAAGTDAVTVTATLTVADTATASDALTAAAAAALTDTGSGADAATFAVAVPLTDTATGSDALKAGPVIGETGTGTDGLSATVALGLADTATAADGFAAGPVLRETSAGADVLAATVTVTLADTATGADAMGVAQGSNPTLPEAAAGADSLTTTAALPLTDTATGTDALTVSQSSNPTLPDTAHGTDGVTVGVSFAVTDTGHGTDSLSPAAAVGLADTATGTDGFTIARQAALTDTAHGTDSITITTTGTLTDAATGTDLVAVAAGLAFADTGAAVDTLTIVRSTTLADAATGVDQLTILVTAAVSDTAVFADDLALAQAIALAETAAAVDALRVVTSIRDITVTVGPTVTRHTSGPATASKHSTGPTVLDQRWGAGPVATPWRGGTTTQPAAASGPTAT